MPGSQAKILVLNQYYWPGIEATAQLLVAALRGARRGLRRDGRHGRAARPRAPGRGDAERRADRAGPLDDLRPREAPPPRRELRELPRRHGARRAARRAAGSHPVHDRSARSSGTSRSSSHAGSGRRCSSSARTSSPRSPSGSKRLRQPLLVGALRRLVALYLKRADRVVAIGETMKLRLEHKGAPAGSRRSDPELGRYGGAHAGGRGTTRGQSEQGIDDVFVVMHSGNIGHAQDLDALVRAATFLRDLDGLQVMVIGFGAQTRRVDAPRAAARRDPTRALPRLPASEPPVALPLRGRPPLRRARARAVRVRRAEPRLRDPLRRQAGARRRPTRTARPRG